MVTRRFQALTLGFAAALFAILLSAQASAAPDAHVWNVRTFGATGDGHHLDTAAVNSAIAACAAGGGGIVEVGPGNYRVGTIRLLSDVTLKLDAGSRLLASADLADYVPISRSSEERSTSLIVAEGAENVGIVGDGVIDGNGRAFVVEPRQPHPAGFYDATSTRQGARFFARNQENRDGPDRMKDRPGILALFLECRNVTVRGITIVDAPNWCLHLACCRSATLDHLTIRNSLRIPNSDAIDLGACRDVRVADCVLEAGDDGIAISPCSDGFAAGVAENITVSRCTIVSRSAGIRLGWAARDIRHVSFDHLVIRDSNRGIGLFVRGQESIEDVTFEDITIESHLVDGAWWGLGEPIHISVAPYNARTASGHVRGVRFRRVTATSESPVVLYASARGQIRDIALEQCRLELKTSPLDADYGGNLDLRPVTPAAQGIVKRDLAALVAVNVDDLKLDELDIRWLGQPSPFFKSALALDACAHPILKNIRSIPSALPTLIEDGQIHPDSTGH
ncbi:MAG TPA: glycosyl hydrolase family 28 protein [Candidatus Didemnitutus sp.]|nr:glycosyl hydrolase family 28 protein [Candidatus Didemnitutus sp.]